MSDVVVNSALSSGRFAMASGPDEQFVVAWVNEGVITCSRFSSTGTNFGDFTVNDAATPATWPVMTATPSGYVIAWTSNSNLFLQRVGPDGRNVGARIQVNTSPVDQARPPALTWLLDGGIVVCWADSTLEVVRGQLFRGDLSMLKSFVVNVPTENSIPVAGQPPHGLMNFGPAVTLLGVGDTGYVFVVAWRRGMSIDMTAAHFQFFNPDGTPATPPPGAPTDSNGKPLPYEQMAKYDLTCAPSSLTWGANGGFCGLRLLAGSQPGFMDTNGLIIDWYTSAGDFEASVNVSELDEHTRSAYPVIISTPTNDLTVVWAQVDQHSANPGNSLRGLARGVGFAGTLPDPAPVTITGLPAGLPFPVGVMCVTTDSGFNTVVAWVEGTTLKMRVLPGNDL